MRTIQIYDVIGDGAITARSVLDQLRSGDDTTVSINSAGGSVTDGLAIYNGLRGSGGKVTTRCEALAGSIASVIFLAGDRREMAEHSFLMIHNPFASIEGDADALRRMASTLDTMLDTLASIYSSRSGQSKAKVKKMMDEETWLTADESKQLGFATHVVADSGQGRIAAHIDLTKFKNAPKGLKVSKQSITEAHRAHARDMARAGLTESMILAAMEEMAAEGKLAPAPDPRAAVKDQVARLMGLTPEQRKRLDDDEPPRAA